MSSQTYQYEMLKPGQIRLINLQPDPDIHAPVRCTLRSISLDHYEYDTIDNYTALSYVWGDGNIRRAVYIGDAQLHITASLDMALRHMRDATRSFCLWADALCIDQSNTEERNTQVAGMGRIYSAARSTTIFLGAADTEFQLESNEILDSLGGRYVSYLCHLSSYLNVQCLAFSEQWLPYCNE